MKAIVYARHGPPEVLRLKEVEKPAPGDGEVLLAIHAASANPIDYYTLRGGPARLVGWLLRRPESPILGMDVAGRVEVVGNHVTQFRPGDDVFGTCAGSFAEYASACEERLALKPARTSFAEAAAAPEAALTALQALRDKGRIQPGQKVLIEGASGGVGTFAVQIARSFRAEVTAVCSTRNLDLVRSIGADHVVDYTREDFTRNGQRYDLILAVNGYHPISAYRRALSPKGIYVMAGPATVHMYQGLLQAILLGPLISIAGGQRLGFMGITNYNQKDLIYIKELLEAGKVVPVIDKRYPLSETAQAIRYLEQGHARGKVVITMGHDHA
jgi:NADPH:quinone reductase-like Zn-dependent oxidoreductase